MRFVIYEIPQVMREANARIIYKRDAIGYPIAMRKTTLVIDDRVVERAQKILGTRGLKDTVDRALEQVIAADARRALVRRLETQQGLDLADEDVMRQAWRE
ncbi:MAG: type II toxin-antitoxin system VapB family antitoxin [Chloroflexota bacterium]